MVSQRYATEVTPVIEKIIILQPSKCYLHQNSSVPVYENIQNISILFHWLNFYPCVNTTIFSMVASLKKKKKGKVV